jgi:hypothetical protein
MRTRSAVLAMLLVGAAVGAAVAQERWDDLRFSPLAEKQAKSRRAAIEAESMAPGAQEWAGLYYAGDGLGDNRSLALALVSGFVFELSGCGGLIDRNLGAVTVVEGVVHLDCHLPDAGSSSDRFATSLVPITWGRRHYLVPVDDIVGFCNEVNQGDEPRSDVHGRYLLRRGDQGIRVIGRPSVPAEYRDCLLAQPITASVIAVGEPSTRPSRIDFKFVDFPVTIDAGRQQGLRPGMELYVTTPHMVEWIRLGAVEEERAEGIMIQTDDGLRPPQVGWTLSTRPPWNRFDDK